MKQYCAKTLVYPKTEFMANTCFNSLSESILIEPTLYHFEYYLFYISSYYSLLLIVRNFCSMIPSEADLIFSQYRKCLSSLLYCLYSLDVAVAGTSTGLVGISGSPDVVPVCPWLVGSEIIGQPSVSSTVF